MTETKCFAWVHFARQPSDLYLGTATDGTAKELVSQSAGASLGDVAGQIVTGIDVQVGDGSIVTNIELVAADGGQVINIKGGERLGAGGQSTNSNLNLCAPGLSIPVMRGMVLNILTAD